ncbi:MAG TPA: phosphatidate cytidylyltransferase [Bacillota bacterium]|nr:phosphatidate cytidylyltransferase [Bacillota bacterium]
MKQRIMTAVIVLIVFIPIVLYGNWPFILLTYLMATIGLFELLKMYPTKESFFIPIGLVTVSLWIILLPEAWQQTSLPKVNVLMILTLLLVIYTVISKNKFTFTDVGFFVVTLIYISMGFYFFMHARLLGLNYLLFILFTIWATDTGAYFSGYLFGKRKLWPKISPNKTIEGAVGGLVLAIIVATIFQFVYPFSIPTYLLIGVTLLISIFGQIGDLVASAYKRHYEIKDSGQLLPGHGGILDRLDSLIFVLPILYIVQFI